MIFFRFVLILSVFFCSSMGVVTTQGFFELFEDIRHKTQKFLSASKSIKSRLPSITDCNGYSVYSNNLTKVDYKVIDVMNIVSLDGTLIDFNTFVYPQQYFLIHLGNIGVTWSVEEFNNFTTILDNAERKANGMTTLFGFTLGFSLNQTTESLPYLKASVRDLKQYLIFKNMNHVPIGIEFDTKDTIIPLDEWTKYFQCDNRYGPNFYFSENRIVDFSHSNYTGSAAFNQSCASVNLKGLNPNFIPYSPRASRCDCIMAMLRCVIDQNSDISFSDDETLLNEICSTVYCGSIKNEPEKGIYGVFASCSNIQRYSIAFNLYYTLHNDDRLCNFDHKAKLLRNKGSANDYMKLLDFDGKQCSEEIMEDWNRYLVGISKKSGDTSEPIREKVYNYDIEFEQIAHYNDGHSDLRSLSARKSLISSTILIWLFTITLML